MQYRQSDQVLFTVLPAAEAFLRNWAETHGCEAIEIVEAVWGHLVLAPDDGSAADRAHPCVFPGVVLYIPYPLLDELDGMIFDTTTVGEVPHLAMGRLGEVQIVFEG